MVELYSCWYLQPSRVNLLWPIIVASSIESPTLATAPMSSLGFAGSSLKVCTGYSCPPRLLYSTLGNGKWDGNLLVKYIGCTGLLF